MSSPVRNVRVPRAYSLKASLFNADIKRTFKGRKGILTEHACITHACYLFSSGDDPREIRAESPEFVPDDVHRYRDGRVLRNSNGSPGRFVPGEEDIILVRSDRNRVPRKKFELARRYAAECEPAAAIRKGHLIERAVLPARGWRSQDDHHARARRLSFDACDAIDSAAVRVDLHFKRLWRALRDRDAGVIDAHTSLADIRNIRVR